MTSPRHPKRIIKKTIADLRLGANARQGNIDPSICETLSAKSIRFVPLLQGLVRVWVIQKPKSKANQIQLLTK